jgi:spoIIIJ-associated protein
MEWVETTGRTIADAKESALDQLGVDEAEAEFEVLEEAKNGLFGRVRREARVRARVRPRAPRPKVERRRQPRGDRKGRARPSSGRGTKPSGAKKSGADSSGGKRGGTKPSDRPARATAEAPDGGADAPSGAPAAEKRPPRKRPSTSDNRSRQPKPAAADEESNMSDPVSVQEQGQMVRGFLEGLVDAFDLDAEVEVSAIDDDTVEVTVDGDDLGVMIGPKGQTLQAIQELSRASLQRSADGPLEGRVRIDIGAYRQKRREALARFAHQQAQEVLDAGVERALEPMSAADRKVVHDTVNEIAGVRTVSEGEDARRRVVIIPD